MNWDHLRFVAAVARHGSLLGAASELEVEHTTVGRRVDAAERALNAKLFARSTTGLVLTEEGQRLLESLQRVEDAVSDFERRASAERVELIGTVKVTAPETFGAVWLAPRLATFARQHPGLHIDLDPSGAVMDLSRREAEVAIRDHRAKQKSLVVRRACEVGHGLYASRSYLSRYPLRSRRDLKNHTVVAPPPNTLEGRWLSKLIGETSWPFTCIVSVGLLQAAKAGAGIAVLPRYMGDAEPELEYLPMKDEPKEVLWLTVHRDLRSTPRVRAVLDFLIGQLERERSLLRG